MWFKVCVQHKKMACMLHIVVNGFDYRNPVHTSGITKHHISYVVPK